MVDLNLCFWSSSFARLIILNKGRHAYALDLWRVLRPPDHELGQHVGRLLSCSQLLSTRPGKGFHRAVGLNN